MDFKRWLMATLGAFGVIAVSDYAIHTVWLGEFYRMNAQWWRTPEAIQAMRGLVIVSEALLAALLTMIYTKGYEANKAGLGQGFRYGVLMGLLLAVPSGLMKAVVYPYPFQLVLNWMLGTFVEVTVVGMIIGYLYKPAK
jgi:hypothetical protein